VKYKVDCYMKPAVTVEYCPKCNCYAMCQRPVKVIVIPIQNRFIINK
jgi:hypothetical protein